MGTPESKRLASLDALRGADMLMIMGVEALVVKFCVLCGWGADCALARQFEHVAWYGLSFEDTIFPLFLFLAGVSWPFSYAKQVERGLSRAAILRRCLKRCALLFLLGLIQDNLLQGTVRLWSVLGRIGLAWLIAVCLHMTLGKRWLLPLAFALPVAYWLLLLFVPAPDALTLALPPKFAHLRDFGTGPFSVVGNLSGWIDRTFVPGKISIPGVADNQSALGLIAAVGTALFGMAAGTFLRDTRGTLSEGRRTLAMLAAAAGLVGAGLVVAHGFGAASMPVCKKLWSASFTFVVAGYSFAMLALFHWVIDVKGCTRWAFPFRVIGMNAITIYVGQKFIPFGEIARRIFGGVASLLPPEAGAFFLQLAYVALCWLFLWFLYRKNVFLKV